MRHYGSVYPQFWTGRTGRQIRDLAKDGALGCDMQRVALYLMTSPHANYIGLYWLPLTYLCEEVGIAEAAAMQTIVELARLEFSFYDQPSEHVWVKEMARYQLGPQLSQRDNKVPAISRLYRDLPANPWLGLFYDRYADALHLTIRRDALHGGASEGLRRGLKAPNPVRSGPVRSSSSSSSSEGEGSKGGEIAVVDEALATPAWIIEQWNAIVGVEPFAMKYFKPTAGLGKQLGTRLTKHPDKAWWEDLFARVRESQWLVEEFHPHLDWALGPKNLEKILQGNYVKTVRSTPKTAFGRLIEDLQEATANEDRATASMPTGGDA